MRTKPILRLLLLICFASCQTKEKLPLPRTDGDNGGLFLPDGFGALVVADSVGPTRHLAVNENGDIYVKSRLIDGDRGNFALRDTDLDGTADEIQRFGDYVNDGTFATEMRIHNGYLYFSSELTVYRQKLVPGKLVPDGKPEVMVIDRHPIRWHNAKSLAFDGEGGMYVTFSAPTNVCEDWRSVDYENTGSSANVKGHYPCPELADFAGVWKFDENKPGQLQSDGKRFATGLRSIVGITWNESDNSLYAVQHGRDYLASHDPTHFSAWQNAVLPAEEFVKIKEGDDFGWPYSYYDHIKGKRMVAPEYGGDGVKEAQGYADPLFGFPAHWAPNDMLFYKGDQFPPRYKNGAFVAFHGSTNRAPYPQAGYIVAFVPFKDGRPLAWEVFADGFAGIDTVVSMIDAKYRPMGLAEGPDGSLYVSESRNGKIWRIVYKDDALKFDESHLAGMEKRKSSRTYIKTPDEKLDLIKKSIVDSR